MQLRRSLLALGASALALVPALSAAATGNDPAAAMRTATPIKHLVVIFQENVSFDHYFGTYPDAANPRGEPAFHAAPGTPTVNGLTDALVTNNPNLGNPQRLDRSQALTCDQGHGYSAEQKAFDAGAMDLFVQDTGRGLTLGECLQKELGTPQPATPGNFAVLDYYDGNTTTAMWNYAQHFAMSDNSYSNVFGPSTPGALNVIAGNTFGVTCGPTSADFFLTPTPCATGVGHAGPAVALGAGTNTGDADPMFDVCSSGSTIAMGGKNIGDLLNAAGVTWGFFEGGFRPIAPGPNGTTVCPASHKNIGGATIPDYIPHHQPFQYYPQTANPQHLPPTSVAAIGHQDQANHQYDLSDFLAAADHGNLPQVSYLKAAAFQDGHAAYSDPLDEQTFLVDTINHLERLPTWQSTAVVIAYDDSDGWYDHQMGPVLDQSQTALDFLTATGQCGANPSRVLDGQQARCGVGPRQPLMVISPFARKNFVDNTLTEQSSVVRFIEDNWRLGRIGGGSFDALSGSLAGMFDFSRPEAAKRLFLDPATGEPVEGGEDA